MGGVKRESGKQNLYCVVGQDRRPMGGVKREWEAEFVLLGRTEDRRSMGGVKRESGKQNLYCLVGQRAGGPWVV